MDFKWNEEQELLRSTARKFIEKEFPQTFVQEMLKDEKGYSPRLWQEMAKLGWLGLIFPEKYGGIGGSYLDLIALIEEMGRVIVLGPLFSTVVLAGLPIMENGTEENRERYLPPICRGDAIMTLALMEEGGSWGAPEIRMQAKLERGKFIISGKKLFVPDAHIASSVIVATKTNKSSGFALLVIDPQAKGISIVPLRTLAGDKEFEIILNGAEVPKRNLIGENGKGWEYMEKTFPKIIAAKCAEMIGALSRVLERTVQYSMERYQFGRPIGTFQVIQHYCADMATDMEISRLLVYQAAWRLSEGIASRKEVSMAKAMCSETLRKATSTAHQIHGGIGFTEEHGLHLYYKYARLWQVLFGGGSFHRKIVADEMGL